MSGCLEMLQEGTKKLHTSLMDVTEDLIDTLNDSACMATQVASTCNLIKNSLNQLIINANYSKVSYTLHASLKRLASSSEER